ncbi:uncharacterized protein MEPE_02328 [Melanopsichium pennsylvanicum]|uniref:Ig-like domain-containing protein n=2 Tax=Melanopsichium pennsylvanicum TaxID=63383 RepID=A0AAJ4XKU2_9BASI|nr:hypothetical protein BN887_03618 [Melanopsichium pennsylvanicum 4]SNX83621.1 uncharacterized protein MEPE_02328 [Melanopsichium pennsylvanicum]
MRFSTAFSCAILVYMISAATIELPSLYSCEPATVRVLAQGNYTIEGRDQDSHKLVFRAHVRKGVSAVTWDSVDLVANTTAVMTVTDQIGSSPTQTALVTASATVMANPSGNTTCLLATEYDRKHKDEHQSQKNMVPTIIGIVLGVILLLVLLLVGGMFYRRRKETLQKIDEDSVDLNHGYSQNAGDVPAGGDYMARLVPGLKLQEARPLPRDPVLESEQANYASTRRGTHHYKGGTSVDVTASNAANFDLPTYGQSQHFSKTAGSSQINSSYYRRDIPFASQSELEYAQMQQQQQQRLYQQRDWQHSQTSFLTKQSSR